jgi:hypothetical protein
MHSVAEGPSILEVVSHLVVRFVPNLHGVLSNNGGGWVEVRRIGALVRDSRFVSALLRDLTPSIDQHFCPAMVTPSTS